MHSSVKSSSSQAGREDVRRHAGRSSALAFLAAGLLAAFYFATSIYIASERLFWFDELFTVHIARLPHLATIWSALGNGVDALPPAYYMLVRTFDTLFGPGEVAARLPSAIALVVGLLVVFDCARRLTDGVHGLVAMSVATCSFLPYYGYEARSYAVCFMLSAVAFWAWTYNGARQNWATFLFGAAFFAGVCFHYYFAMCLVPYVLWEMLRWKPGHRPSSELLAGVAGTIIPLVLLSPLILSFSRKFSGGYWNRPTFLELRAIFSQLFPDGLFLLVLITLWIVLVAWDREQEPAPAMQSVEAIGWLFLVIPLAAFVVAEWKTNAFYSRYFIGVIPGVAVAFILLLWRRFRRISQISAGVFVLLAGWGVGQQLTAARHPDKVEATGIRAFLQVESSLQLEGRRYFVFSEPLLFLEAQQYSNHPEECVLLLASDFSRQRKPGPDPYLHQRLELNLSPYYPLQVWTIDDLRRHEAASAVIEPDEQALIDIGHDGMQTHVRFSSPLKVDYVQ
ncbi:MAG TPA: glycosyltransferase family 39 protein [Candidatus Binatia bacterium]|nr:glycosyltransferase family 39 protein [Candidatus Binatia bacterium]